ncbi:MAG: hypothetical protein J6X18_00085 [Bacteroidales bacterium]|nr:hypothetical protein [Bacteroidales bacterium]
MEKKNSNLTFGVDIDEVLRSLIPGMVRLYNEEFGENMSIDDVKDFVVDNSFPKIMERTGESASKWFFQDHGKELFLESDEIKGSKEALDTLRKYGKVIIISYQKSLANKIDTLQWLSEHGMEYDGICFVKDKSVVHVDWLIDDNDWNFIGTSCVFGALINAPYNEGVDVNSLAEKGGPSCAYIKRYNSLLDFSREAEFIYSGKFLRQMKI